MSTYSCLLLALLIAGANAQCPPLFELIGGKCLAFFTDPVIFTDAIQSCEYFGGKIAKIDDCHLMADVVQYLRDNGIENNFWIDATDVLEEGTFIWSDGTPVPMGAPFWDSSSPSGSSEPQDDGDDCIAMDPYDGFYFHNNNCSAEYHPLCQHHIEENSPCTLPYIEVAGGCYYLFQDVAATWERARLICNNFRGDLAIIDDCSDMAPIINFVSTINPVGNVWIGGRRESSTWYWIDGSDVRMEEPFWGRDQSDGLEPNGGIGEDCVTMSTNYRYRFLDVYCYAMHSPMCEAPLLTAANPDGIA